LQATYGDPNKELSVWSRLENLKQGKKSFLAHFPDLRRLIADTGLSEAVQNNQLHRSLFDDVRCAMNSVKIPHELNEYAYLIGLYNNEL
jgi:hypothetical protein